MLHTMNQQEENQGSLPKGHKAWEQIFKGKKGHLEISSKFKDEYLKGKNSDNFFDTLRMLDLSHRDKKEHDHYIENLKQLSEKNFCRFLFSVYAKRKYKEQGYSLEDAEHGIKRFGHLFIILACALVSSFIVFVLMANFAPSLLIIAVSLAAIYCTFNVLSSFFQKKEISQEDDLSKKNKTIVKSDEEIINDCMDECLFRNLSDSIFDLMLNLFPGKSLCAKMPGPVGKFFDNTRETKPNNGENAFVVNIILENVGVMILTTVMAQMFAVLPGVGAAAGTLTALGIVCALTCAVFKVVRALFSYDKKLPYKEQEELDKKLEKQRTRYHKEYGELLNNLESKVTSNQKSKVTSNQKSEESDKTSMIPRGGDEISTGHEGSTEQPPSSQVEGASDPSQLGHTNGPGL